MLARNRTRLNRLLYLFLVIGIAMPINYVTLTKVMQVTHLVNTQLGMIILYAAFKLPFAVFVIYAFVHTVPIEIDEAAIIDGCAPRQLFWRIMVPLLRPAWITVGILTFLDLWSEFIMPLYFLSSSDKWPMTLAVYNFFGIYESSWNLVSADVVLDDPARARGVRVRPALHQVRHDGRRRQGIATTPSATPFPASGNLYTRRAVVANTARTAGASSVVETAPEDGPDLGVGRGRQQGERPVAAVHDTLGTEDTSSACSTYGCVVVGRVAGSGRGVETGQFDHHVGSAGGVGEQLRPWFPAARADRRLAEMIDDEGEVGVLFGERGTSRAGVDVSAHTSNVRLRSASRSNTSPTPASDNRSGSGSRCTRCRTPTTGSAAQRSSRTAAATAFQIGTHATTPATCRIGAAVGACSRCRGRCLRPARARVVSTPMADCSELDVGEVERPGELRHLREPRIFDAIRMPDVHVRVDDVVGCCGRVASERPPGGGGHDPAGSRPEANTSSVRCIAVLRWVRIASAAPPGSRSAIASAMSMCSELVAAPELGVVVEPVHVEVATQSDERFPKPRVPAKRRHGVVERGVVDHVPSVDRGVVVVA